MAMNNTIKALREQNNYSQAAVAQFLGISRQMYIKYENGLVEPPVKIVSELAHFYHVTYDFIIDDSLSNKKGVYDIPEVKPLEVHDSASQSMYLKSIAEMLPKLIYREQLLVLEMVAEIVRNATAEKIMPEKKKPAIEQLLMLNEKYHLKSDGTKWTRDEIYER